VRLHRLELEHFGHFRRQGLAFEAKGLSLVHGRNEAGKTTVLEAIRWLLFGGTGARFAFDDDASQLAVSARAELKSGSTIDIRRNNGKNKGLRGTASSGDEIDEDWILTMLHRPNRAVFENVFGFSLAGLAKGADALEHADLKNSIFGGGLGGTVQPGDILADLTRAREALFKEGGKNQPIHVRAKKIESLTKSVAQLTTRAEDWNRLQGDFEQRKAAATEALERLLALRRREAELRALLEARPLLVSKELAAAELATLRVPEGIPEDAETKHAHLSASLEGLERDAKQRLEEIAEADDVLAREIDEVLLARDAEIATLANGLDRYLRAAEERPLRASELEQLERRARDRLASLRPAWDLGRLRGFHVDAAARANLDEAIAEGEALDTRLAGLELNLRELEEELRVNDAARAALPAEVDVAPHRAWLDAWSELAAQRSIVTATAAEIRTSERKRSALLAKLDPPLPSAARDVRTPPPDVLAAFELERAGLDERTRVARADRARLMEELVAVDDELRRVDPERRAPTENDLVAARARRDGLLEELVAALGAPRTDVHTVVRSHDRAVRDADDVADRMRLHTDAVRRRADATAQRTRLVETLATIDAAIAELATVEEEHETRWRSTWSGLIPRSPAAMRAWIGTCEQLATFEETIAEASARRDRFEATLAEWEERGRRLLGRDAPSDELRTRARALVETEERRARDAAALERDRARAEPRLDALRGERTKLEEVRAQRRERWPSLLAGVGLEPELSRGAARALIAGLVEARTELVHGEQPLREQLVRLDEELAAYRERARGIVGDDEPVVAVRAIEARLVSAREALRARKGATAARGAATRKLERADNELVRVRGELDALRSAAGVRDDDAFREVLRARARRRELVRDLALADQTLGRLRGHLSEDEFVTAIRAVDVGAATHELESVELDTKKLAEKVRELDEAVGHARAQIEAVDGRQDAADALGAVEAERAALRDEVERWSVLTLAENLLSSAIKRFEREHQPGLLGRASAILSAMTDGRYVAIRRGHEKTAVERHDGRELSPEALSTGTREQLYLAIRLAYVEHYCANAEPLPIVLDDVLVNFDDDRATATLRALAEFSSVTQVMLFTCHRSTIALAEAAGVAANTLEVPARG